MSRKPYKRLTSEEQQQILLLHQQGVPPREIATQFDKTYCTVRDVVERLGGEYKYQKRLLSTEDKQQINDLYQQGISSATIAEQLGRHPSVILHYLHRTGAKVRKRGGSKPLAQSLSACISPVKLAAVRKRAGLSQAQLAERIGCPKPDLIREWETGRKRMSGNYLLRFLLVCRCKPGDIAE